MIHRDPRLGALTPYSNCDPGIGGCPAESDPSGLNWTILAIAAAAAFSLLKLIGNK